MRLGANFALLAMRSPKSYFNIGTFMNIKVFRQLAQMNES